MAYNIPRMVSVFSLKPDEPVSIRSSAFAKASGKVVVLVGLSVSGIVSGSTMKKFGEPDVRRSSCICFCVFSE